MDVEQLRLDLLAEQQALDDVVAAIEPGEWMRPTASPGWTVADQVAHLAWFDRAATTAILDPGTFEVERAVVLSLIEAGSQALDGHTLGAHRQREPAELLEVWRDARAGLAEAARGLGADARIEWYGPSMGARSFLTARLMEAWAHGQDVVDAVGARREATDRLRHVAQLGVLTRGWSYRNRGLEPPSSEVRVELQSPRGDSWAFGTEETRARVTGPAEDFCLVVTQRRHLDDTALVTTGEPARDWMLRSQAFAGPPTDGPAPVRSTAG